MRIVRIADLSEEERKKALEEQEERYQKNTAEREAEIQRVNKLFEEESKKQETLPIAKNGYTSKNKSFLDKVSYIGKNLNSGILSGTAGIAQSGLTDIANQMEKGTQKNIMNILGDSANALVGIVNPMQSLNNTIKKMPERIGNAVTTLTDKDKSAIEKITSIGLDATNAPIEDNQYKNLLDVGSQVIGKISPNASNEILNINNKISEPLQQKQQKLAEEADEYGKITQTLGGVAQVIGNMAPSIAVSTLTKNPNAGLATMAMSAKGQSTQEALNKGAELDEAIKIGNTKAMIEVGTEMLTGGVNIFGKGALDDIVQRGIVDKVKNNIAKKLVQQGVNISGEVLEETISDILDTTIDKGTIDPNASYSINDWKDTALTTTLSTIVLNALTGGLGSVQSLKNKNTNLQQNQVNNENSLQTQQTIQEQNKTAQNQTSGQLNDILNNKELPMQSYQYKKSDDVKINNLRQDANKYFNNSEEARNYVNMLEKIITDKNIDIRLDTNLRTTDGRMVNGSYSNGVITINPNSTRTGEFIAIHELTHAIGTDSMKNIVETYRKSNKEFDSAVEKLLQNYKSTEITEEALSDISAQLFGNQEFINNIAQNNPNIFQKLYSEIKYLWHQFRGYNNQDQFIEDLYYKWTQAYNSNNKLNETSNYYIETIENFDEIKYNNTKEIKLPKQEYAILSGIVNSDSNIKPGRNYVETTNATYEVYFKETGEFKVVGKIVDGGYNDTITNGNIQGTGSTRNAKSRMQVHSSTIQQSKTGTRNDEISNFNKRRTRISDTSIGNGTSNSNNVKYSIQESENNSGSFSMDNQGRTLTKEQQDYFKDSKVRDENGNLKTMYHGSNNKFTIFKHGEAYGGSSKASVGYWFTETAKGAENFANSVWYGDTKTGAKVYEVYLNIKNPKIYNRIDNTNELHKIDNKIDNLKETIRKLENKNIAIEINKQELRWANSKEELRDIAKYEGIDFEDAENYHNAIKQYNELIKEYDNKKYNDSYELFRADIYKIAGKSANEANIGGTGMYLSNEEEVVKQYVEDLKKQGYDGIIIKNTKFDNETLGKDNSQYVVFEPNQVKNVSNTNPTENPDIRYSQNNETWQSYLDQNYKATGTRTNLQDIKLPTAQKQVAPSAKNNVLSTGEYTKQNGINQNNIEINSDLPISENQKFRKHYKSIIQSQYTTDEARAISKELMKSDTYVPESNNKQLERADKRIELSGADSELNSLMSRSMTGGDIKADDIAVGERLIQYYSKTGNKTKLQEAIQATAMAGTTAGQTVQAMSLLNHQTPEGQAVWLQRSVEKMNNDLIKTRGEKADQFTLTPEMTEKIVNSKNAEELQNNLNEVYEELGQQVTKTNLQKIDAWRYFSMLANPRTHIRNIVGNTAMGGMQYGIKNKIAGSIESVVSKINPEMERTHTIVPTSKEVKQFAKNDIKNVADRLGLNENKYNPKTRLENSMRTFKSDIMEKTLGKLFDLNDNALEAEDGWGLKAGYTKALSEYMTANKLTPENITDKQLAKARNYAIEQAQEATFHQTSALSTLLNQFSNKNKVTKFIMDSTLPFKKTPINVAKSGLEYSPIGLVKSAIYDTIELRKGNITINKYIDNISKGLTGTGIALLGYALADAGILKASGSDDKDKESFDQDRGSQTYSIQIGDNTFSLDWLSPFGIPLFIGAECFEIMQTNKETKTSSSDEDSLYNQAIKSATNILDAFTNAMNPMTEMSMLSGLTSALKSYDGDNSKMLANLGVNAVKSYVNQFIPTALGQVAKTTDEYERSTTSTKTGTLPKAIDTTKNYAMSKIPGLRQMLPTKTDIWGNELKQNNNVLLRGLENSVAPWTRKELTATDVDKELNNVYKNTGESSVLPDPINKNLTIDKQKYVMTSEEYAKYKSVYGTTSYNLLNNLVKSNNYKNMSDSQKQYAIEKVYDYATEQIKVDYAKNNKLEYEESKLSQTINAMKKTSANVSNYFEYLALTEDTTKNSEKIEVLANSNFSNKTKELIYENNIKETTDKKYEIVKGVENFNINSYLEYKLADSNEEFKADRKDDGTERGTAIRSGEGSSKDKKYNYILSMENTPYMQKVILFGLETTPEKSDKATIVNYIMNMQGKNNTEKKEMLKQFNWITWYKDGTFDYK